MFFLSQPLKRTRHCLPGLMVTVIFFLAICFRSFALDPAKSIFQYNCQTWTRQNGLPVSGVNAIAQARDGYLWLGTTRGLVSFDGVEFNLFDIGHLSHLPSTIVRSLANSQNGNLWFGLERGSFGLWDGRSVSFMSKDDWGGRNLNVQSIFQARNGDLWIAAETQLGRLTHEGIYQALLTGTIAKDRFDITAVSEGSKGRIWFGTALRGLYSWQDGKITKFPSDLFDTMTIRAVAEDGQGQIWVGADHGLFCFDSRLERKPLPYPWYEARVLLVDRHGIVWAGTTGGGLARFDTNVFVGLDTTNIGPRDLVSRFTRTNGLADDFVTALTEDSEGNIWVGTRNGLSQLSDVKIPTYGKTEGLGGEVFVSVSPSHKGGLWVATDAGLDYFDQTVTNYSAASGLKEAYLVRAFEARNGDVYLINGAKDIEILSGGKVVTRYQNPNWPTAFVEDDQGVIVSINAELFRIGTNYFKPYEFADKQKPVLDWIFNMDTGPDGSIWIASDLGICRVKDGIATLWNKQQGLAAAKVLWVFADSDGTVWAGLESGLARLKNGRIRNLTREHGLPADNIYAILPDDRGSFWVDSSQGIFQISRKGLNDFCDGISSEVHCLAYDGLNAVKSDDKNQQKPSGAKTRNGRIWFPTTQGIVMIDPDRITTNNVPPEVYISRVRANGRELNKTGKAVVPPSKGELEFGYVGLSFIAPQKIQYRYQLDGYDMDWVDAGTRRSAFYTNLKPGQYRFNVIACNSDGVWSKTGDSFEVELLPHFYQTAWFYPLCVLLGSLVVGGVVTGRVRSIRRKHQEVQKAHDLLEVKVGERTTELKAEIHQRKQIQAELELQKTQLENEIEERKRMEKEMERIHRQLVDASRVAGQAEVASSVLHNVGNVLNSVNVSASLMADRLRASKAVSIAKIADLLEAHRQDLLEFLTKEHRAEQIADYLKELSKAIASERITLLAEVQQLTNNIDHIKQVVAMQQGYARVAAVLEIQSIPALVEDALRMNEAALERHDVQVIREFEPIPEVLVDRHKILQILVNLISNAKQALTKSSAAERQLTLKVSKSEADRIRITVADNGVGIPPENLTRIFSHGFTTRPDGHGFGLHSGFLTAREMGGTLLAHSDGPNKGAVFVLEIPSQSLKKPGESDDPVS